MKLRLGLSLAVLTMVSTAAFGQATRTWVSGVGDDVNPCSRTAPCKTFAGAISKTAAGGEINVLDPGGFGTVTITKSITIDGGGTYASILNSSTNGVNVSAAATDTITLRNLTINGAGSANSVSGLKAVNITTAKQVIIENVNILGSQTGISATPSTANLSLFVTNVTITNCSVSGVSVSPTSVSVSTYLEELRVSNIGTTTAHDGIFAGANTTTHLRNVRVFKSAGAGFHTNGTGASATIDQSSFVRNGGDGVLIEGAGSFARISDTTSTQNSGAGFRLTGGSIFSYRNNRSHDNGLGDTANTQQNFY